MFGYSSIGGAMDSDCYTLKIKYGSRISCIGMRKLFTMGAYQYLKFNVLEDIVRRKFQIPETSELNMVYTDIENDEVIITDDEDIQFAIDQKPSPLRVTVRVSEPHQSAHDVSPRESLASDLTAELILKLDEVLLAVNKKLDEPKVELVINTESAKTKHHGLEGVDASTTADSTIKPFEDLTPAEDWTDIAQSGYDSEFLRRATILRQRVDADKLYC